MPRRAPTARAVLPDDRLLQITDPVHQALGTSAKLAAGRAVRGRVVVTDLDGKKISGQRDPSSELKMHLEVYRNRPDARAVVHAHPRWSTLLTMAGAPFKTVADYESALKRHQGYATYLDRAIGRFREGEEALCRCYPNS